MTDHELRGLWTHKEVTAKVYNDLRAEWDELIWPEGPQNMDRKIKLMAAWDAKYDAEKAFIEAVAKP